MIKTTKKINLAQLDKELNAGGLNMESKDGENTISAVNDKINKTQLETAIAAHIAIDDASPTMSEKLAAIGLSIDDLKAALGV